MVSGGGAITITGFASNSVSGDTAGAGMSISNVIFDATPGGAVQAVDADTLAIGTAANPVGLGGLAVVTSTGSIAFDDLDVFSASGTALSVTGPGPGHGTQPQRRPGRRPPAPARARSSPRTAPPWC